MWWRLTSHEFNEQKGDGNRRALKTLIAGGIVPGLIAYEYDIPVGWCSVAPRDHFPRLDRSPILKKVDTSPVWSVVCFFVSKSHRNTGLSVVLLKTATEYVRRQGGLIVEGYPHEAADGRKQAPSVFTGLFSAFLQAGFTEVARRSDSRPIMRYYIHP
jgi:GNAT superfamily N-acetyltransferase